MAANQPSTDPPAKRFYAMDPAFTNQLDRWLFGLARGSLQGGAIAVKSFAATACAHAVGMNIPALNVRQAAVVFGVGALWHLFDFLATHPLPDDEAPTTEAEPKPQFQPRMNTDEHGS